MTSSALTGSTVEPPPLAALAGDGLTVPLVTGGELSYANFDHAATAPCLESVRAAVDAILPWYSSVHRGAGVPAEVCSGAYEQARETLREFTGAGPETAVIFSRNTTDAFKLLAHCLPDNTTVIGFDSDHHAALLAWQRSKVHHLPTPATPGSAVAAVDAALRTAPDGPHLVCVTGASNVTGEIWPLADLADVAHHHGARIAVDAAQLAPHRPVRMSELGLDYLALSGHKMYAPFGAGALIGRADWLSAAPPYLPGGGAARKVSEDTVVWAEVPARHEGGTPNLLGAVALAAACRAISTLGWPALRSHEEHLLRTLRDGLASVPGLRELQLWGGQAPRVGIVAFTIDRQPLAQVAAALAAEHAIGVRHGKFCAHPLVSRLTAGGGALRASIGIGTTSAHVARLINALHQLTAEGPRWAYADRDGHLQPEPDPRPWPSPHTSAAVDGGCTHGER